MALTDGRGVDTEIEAVGIPATFELCEKLVAVGGVVANVGVHGTKVDLHLEDLWDPNVTITTRLVDTASTPMLLASVRAKKLDPLALVTYRFDLGRISTRTKPSSAPRKGDAGGGPGRPRRHVQRRSRSARGSSGGQTALRLVV